MWRVGARSASGGDQPQGTGSPQGDGPSGSRPVRLQQRGALPGVGLRRGRHDHRGEVAQELLERRDDCGRLLRGGRRRDDLQLGAAVGHGGNPTGRPAPRPSRPTLGPCLTSPSWTTTRCSPPSRRAEAIDRTRDAFLRHRARRVADAGQGLPRVAAARRLPRDARARRRAGDPEVDLVVPGQPRARPADGDGRSCWSATPRPASRSRCSTRARSPRCARARSRRSPRGRWRARTRRRVGIVGCGLHGAWAARCLAADGYGPGVCFDPRPEAAAALADELGLVRSGRARRRWPPTSSAASRRAPRPSSTPATCVPGSTQHARRRRPGQGGGDDRRRRRLHAVLRRVGAGVARRRADGRGRGGPRGPRAT